MGAVRASLAADVRLSPWGCSLCRLGLGAALAVSMGASAVHAQVAVPTPVAPGRPEQEFRPTPAPPSVLPPPEIKPLPTPAPPSPAALSFVLKDVIVDGSTVYTPAQLRAAYASFLGKTISVDDLAQIEEAITRTYRNDGYILARALVPGNQSIDPKAGIVHVQVYEGYIDKVRLDPLDYEVGAKGRLIKEILDKIVHGCRPGETPKDGKPCPLHRDTLERYLLLVNDLPGVKASAVIQPSPDTIGAADLFVTITQTHVDGTAEIDNRGTRYTGPLTAQASASLDNLTGFFDRTTLSYVNSIPFNELSLVNLSEDIPIGTEGLRFGINGSVSRAHPGDALRFADLVSHTDTITAMISYPWIRTRSQNLLLRGGFGWEDAVTNAADTRLFTDKTRALSVGASYDVADRMLGVNLVDVSVTQGLGILGATPADSPQASHAGADGNFTKFNAELSRLQELYPEWNLLTAATGQYSIEKLLVAQQLGYGGSRYGRAYDPSELLGDRGILGKVELQYTPAWAPGLLGAHSPVQTLQLYGFYDVGKLWNLGPGEPDPSAASAGGGVRFTLTGSVSGYVEMALPLNRPVQSLLADGQNGKAARLFFSIASIF